jgi:hypothetical protein
MASHRMNSPQKLQMRAIYIVVICLLVTFQGTAHAAEGGDGITAVASRASKDYVRARLPDGSFQPENYAFGEGGNWGGELNDVTMDKLSFLDVAHAIAASLANQKYLPTKDPTKTKLLIMVYWGTTAVPMSSETDPLYNGYQQSLSEYNILLSEAKNSRFGGALMDEADGILTSGLHELSIANHNRDLIDFKNAAMLGYDYDGLVGTDYGKYIEHTALGRTQKDEVDEIEQNRYFVVLMAYDFQILWKQKKHKLLWETRFSIREANHQFDRDLPSMAQYASQYFGQDSHGLVRKAVQLGHVDIGDVKSLGEVEEPKR